MQCNTYAEGMRMNWDKEAMERARTHSLKYASKKRVYDVRYGWIGKRYKCDKCGIVLVYSFYMNFMTKDPMAWRFNGVSNFYEGNLYDYIPTCKEEIMRRACL